MRRISAPIPPSLRHVKNTAVINTAESSSTEAPVDRDRVAGRGSSLKLRRASQISIHPFLSKSIANSLL